MKNVRSLALGVWLVFGACGVTHAQDRPIPEYRVNWLTDLDLALQKARQEKKPILVDIVTDWCAYCNLMDQRIYRKSDFAEYINKTFIPVRLNAECEDTLTFQGARFPYHPEQRVNELPYQLLGGRLEYPATAFLTSDGTLIQTVFGFIEPEIMPKLLRYFGDGYYKTNDWNIYMNRY